MKCGQCGRATSWAGTRDSQTRGTTVDVYRCAYGHETEVQR